ncbi:protoheme IX farnesyltransferase [Geomonas sp. Red32]|uniref:protoheme IX farnesyltransferase n=1 Tax=Geomonas sp. Red32 TaxID=2912856 RepID=UPI00202CBB5F|nr:protoheme IX farnesyltransferase [Geomonas sp. Red32]
MRGLRKLFRWRLALVNGMAALAGYLLWPGTVDTTVALSLVMGVTMLASAGSAFNQVMERKSDAVMSRTWGRPLVSGDMIPSEALVLGAVMTADGLAILGFSGGIEAALLGAAALAWYLGIYTPLKRRTPFALLLGALCGATPPVIGWCAAGGAATDFPILLLALILFLWQVPHFWLLQRRYADDYRRAGFPIFLPPSRQGGRVLCLVWIFAMIAAAMMLPAFDIVSGRADPWSLVLFVPLAVALVNSRERVVFAGVTLFPLLVTAVVFAGR